MASLTSVSHRADHWDPGLVDGVEREGHSGHRPTGLPARTRPAVGTLTARRTVPTLEDDRGDAVPLRGPPGPGGVPGAVAHRGPGRRRCPTGWSGPPTGAPTRPVSTWPGCGGRRTRTTRPSPTAATRPGGGQPGGEPPGRRRAAAVGRHPGVGDGDRVGRPGPRCAPDGSWSTCWGPSEPAWLGRGHGRVGPAARPARGPGGGPDLAGPVDGGGRPHLQRRPAGAAWGSPISWPATRTGTPRSTLSELVDRSPELVLLPDEPYPFAPDDGPEAFAGIPTALVSGRDLTWYGPSMATSRADAVGPDHRGARRSG